MTFTKLGMEFSDEAAHANLSDHAYRTHVEAIQYVFRVEALDCRIPKNLVGRFTGSRLAEEAIRELVSAKWWRDDPDHYVLVHHANVIRSGIVAQQKKLERDRKAQAAAARRRRAALSADLSADLSTDVSAEAVSQSDRQATRAASNGSAWPDVWEPS